jgi:Amt family ammonium transporter
MNALNSGDVSWMLTSSALVLFMTPGLAFFYGGMVKRKNIINTMMSSVFIMGLASILWVLFGFSLSFSGDVGGIFGNFNWFGLRLTETADAAVFAPNTLTFAIFQMMFAIITPALITGAIVERIRFSALISFFFFYGCCACFAIQTLVWLPVVFSLSCRISIAHRPSFATSNTPWINSSTTPRSAQHNTHTRKPLPYRAPP